VEYPHSPDGTAAPGARGLGNYEPARPSLLTEQTITWNQRGINWRGTWASGTAYAVNDAVA
jgi:hypothetical protein